jgi:hypothetical protein
LDGPWLEHTYSLMTNVIRIAAYSIAGAIIPVALSCSPEVPEMRQVAGTDRVIITDFSGDTLRVITDTAQVTALEDFVNSRTDKWERSWDGLAAPRVNATFYSASAVTAEFRAGRDFFFANLPGGSAIRTATELEVKEFVALLGVSPDVLKAQP